MGIWQRGAMALAIIAVSSGARAQEAKGTPPAATFEVESAAQPAAAQPAAAQPAEPVPGATQEPAPVVAQEPAPVVASPMPEASPGQGSLAPNGVYIELLGPGLLYSLNYERIIGDKVSLRLGVSGWGGSSNDGISTLAVAVPMTISYVGIRDRQHGFEVGGGGSVLYGGSASGGVSVGSIAGTGGLATLFGGYRLHPVDKMGFQLRVGLGIQAMFINNQSLIYPWPYLSLGAGF